jgi:lipid II:glycine glycyltransferase (peptidoglycan interpeptide bridge formation enzyme)
VNQHIIQDPSQWNQIITSTPGGHLLQSWKWGQLKAQYGWRVTRLSWQDEEGTSLAAAQVMQRRLPFPGLGDRISMMYCPRGPVLDWSDPELRRLVLSELSEFASLKRAIFLKIDPSVPLGYGFPGEDGVQEIPVGDEVREELLLNGWGVASDQVQFANTLTLDIRPSEAVLLEGMKQKTRYNVRLASRRGVVVQLGDMKDFDLLYRMYAETSVRDGFVIRNPSYYQDAWGAFIEAGMAQPLIAFKETEPIAALIAFKFARTATFLYGMSRDLHRNTMPNHLLQWEAIRWSKDQDCDTYDFWGAPDQLEPQDPLMGVYRFKKGFGARVVRTIGAWDFPIRKRLYWLYSVAMPRILQIMRFRGRTQTRRQLEG